MRTAWIATIVLWAAALAPAAAHAQGAALDPRHAACELAVVDAAARHGVPVEVLRALAFVESGRTVGGSRGPWPWTINLEGVGGYFDTRAEAESFAAQALLEGRRSFDVGCMQLNHYWHGDAFASLSEMFDPAANADYAARFLLDLYRETGDWLTAAGYYHSRTPEHFERYRGLVEGRIARLGAPPARGVLLAALDAPTSPIVDAAAPVQIAGLAPDAAFGPERRPSRADPSPADAVDDPTVDDDPQSGPLLAGLAGGRGGAGGGVADPPLYGSASRGSLFGDWRGLLRSPRGPLLAADGREDASGDQASEPEPEASDVSDAAEPASGSPDVDVIELSPSAIAALAALGAVVEPQAPVAPVDVVAPEDEPATGGSDDAAAPTRPASAGGVGLGALPRGRALF